MMVSTNVSAISAPDQLAKVIPFPTQNWTAYNAAQCEEKARFMELLADLCKDVPQPAYKTGRPRLPIQDMIFACAYKVYSGFSVRRFTSDLRDAKAKKFVYAEPHFNSVSRYMADPMLTPALTVLVTKSAIPLKTVESDFAIDSSGFSTSRFVKWFNKKYGRETENREWVKCHLVCGTKTNIVSSVEISGWEAHDTNYFESLLERTAMFFDVDEFSADKAYLSHKNLEAVEGIGATPFIPFKSNTVPVSDGEDSAWARMYHYFMYNRQEFMEQYHRRSNVETVFSMVKAKFGDAVRSKSDVGMVNEVLCKVLCHNIAVLVMEMHELGIVPRFN